MGKWLIEIPGGNKFGCIDGSKFFMASDAFQSKNCERPSQLSQAEEDERSYNNRSCLDCLASYLIPRKQDDDMDDIGERDRDDEDDTDGRRQRYDNDKADARSGRRLATTSYERLR